MGYAYEDLSDSQFEGLVVEACRHLFGEGIQSFAAGRDGGRDGRFQGTAEKFPSSAAPWSGITVIQAKHTNSTNTHFSDANFSGITASSILTKELARVRLLVEAGELDNYILFANRRLGGVTAGSIKSRIANDIGIQESQVHLCGIEYMDSLLRRYPELVLASGITPFSGPLLVSSYDIAEVILALSAQLDAAPMSGFLGVVDRVSYGEKNLLNNMSESFASELSRRYLSQTDHISKFLSDPGNVAVRERYDGAVTDFQLKIVAKRHEYETFDDVFNYLADFLIGRDSVLAVNKPLTRAMIFYMYWHCDIGEVARAEAD